MKAYWEERREIEEIIKDRVLSCPYRSSYGNDDGYCTHKDNYGRNKNGKKPKHQICSKRFCPLGKFNK